MESAEFPRSLSVSPSPPVRLRRQLQSLLFWGNQSKNPWENFRWGRISVSGSIGSLYFGLWWVGLQNVPVSHPLLVSRRVVETLTKYTCESSTFGESSSSRDINKIHLQIILVSYKADIGLCGNMTLRKIAIWLSKNCPKLDIFSKELPKIVIFSQKLAVAIFVKKITIFGHSFEKNDKLLAIFWHSNVNFPEGQVQTDLSRPSRPRWACRLGAAPVWSPAPLSPLSPPGGWASPGP